MFSTFYNIYEQLPFFCCYNNIINDDCQKDIAKYIYCDDTKVQAYSGCYGDIPTSWVEKHFIIKSALKMINKKLMEKNKNA